MDGNALNKHDIFRWRLHAKSDGYRRHLDYAIQAIYASQKCGKSILSWSAGKDSTAMVHLVKTLYPKIPIMIQFDDCDWPEKREYVKQVTQTQGWPYHAVEPNFSVWEKLLSCQIGFENICSQSHGVTQDSFISLLNAKQNELGCSVVFLGLRSQESHSRYLNLAKRGELYQLKNGEWRCCPLGRWTTEDVFAYHVIHDIEINPCYFNNRFFHPEEIRLSWALPTPTGIRYGDMQHIRFYYPEQYQRLREIGGNLQHAF